MTPTDLAIYVHWPFCRSKCPYCDFNSHVRASIDQGRWRAAYLGELERSAGETRGRTVVSVFFGGGTPSLADPETIAAIIARIRALWPVSPDVEITLEANPTSVEADRFAALRDAGVNRVSLGVQALNDEDLRTLGRAHSAADALAAVRLAARTFPRFSLDLIHGRPGQTVAAWEAELRSALDLGPAHLSAYQLTIEEGTAFHAVFASGRLKLPDEDVQAEMFDRTGEILADAGLHAYEVSNHARPGEESRHNLVYWRYGDYLGIGPGAHGRLTLNDVKFATRAVRAPEAWLSAVEAGAGEEEREIVDAPSRGVECLMMGSRLTEGVPLARLAAETGRDPFETIDRRSLERLIAGGFLELTPTTLRATPAGRRVLNAVLGELLA